MNKRLNTLGILILVSSGLLAQTNKCLVTEKLFSKADNTPINKEIIQYDKHNNPIEIERIQYFGSSAVSSKTTYEYNAQKKPIKTEYYFAGKLTKTVVNEYDNMGNKTLESELVNGKILNRSTTADNRLIAVFLDENGKEVSKNVSEISKEKEIITTINAKNDTISFDKKILSTSGKVVEKVYKDYQAAVNKMEKFQYNAKDDLVRKETYLDNVLQSYTLNEYSGGQISKSITYTKNDLEDYRTEYKYSNGNLAEILGYYRTKLVSIQKREYDNKNNCIKESNLNSAGEKINVTIYKYTCN